MKSFNKSKSSWDHLIDFLKKVLGKWVLWLFILLDVVALIVQYISPDFHLGQSVYFLLASIGVLWASYDVYKELATENQKLLQLSESPIEDAIELEIDNEYRDNDGNQIVSIKVKNLLNDDLECYASAKSITKWIEGSKSLEKNENLSQLTHAGSLFSWSGGSNEGKKTIFPGLSERVNIAQGHDRKMMFLLQNNMEYFEQYANSTFILEIEIGGKVRDKRIKPVNFVGNLVFHKAEHFSFIPEQEGKMIGSDTDGNTNIDLSQYEPYDKASYRLLKLNEGDPRRLSDKNQA